jgi:hypothetical protein
VQELMGNEMDLYKHGKRELCEHECDPHSLTRTRTLKGGWFGLIDRHVHVNS